MSRPPPEEPQRRISPQAEPHTSAPTITEASLSSGRIARTGITARKIVEKVTVMIVLISVLRFIFFQAKRKIGILNA